MKKLTTFLLALVIALFLTACGGSNVQPKDSEKEQTAADVTGTVSEKQTEDIVPETDTETASDTEETSDTEDGTQAETLESEDAATLLAGATWWGFEDKDNYYEITFNDDGTCSVWYDEDHTYTDQGSGTYQISENELLIYNPDNGYSLKWAFEFLSRDVVYVYSGNGFCLFRLYKELNNEDCTLIGGYWWGGSDEDYYELEFRDGGKCHCYYEDEEGVEDEYDALYELNEGELIIRTTGSEEKIVWNFEYYGPNVIFVDSGDGFILLRAFDG